VYVKDVCYISFLFFLLLLLRFLFFLLLHRLLFLLAFVTLTPVTAPPLPVGKKTKMENRQSPVTVYFVDIPIDGIFKYFGPTNRDMTICVGLSLWRRCHVYYMGSIFAYHLLCAHSKTNCRGRVRSLTIVTDHCQPASSIPS